MAETYYTLAMWRVKPEYVADFPMLWMSLAEVFKKLPAPPGAGTLLQSTTEPDLFYSFGPWRQLENIDAMRRNPRAVEAIRKIMNVCIEATPGNYRHAAEVLPDRSN